MPPLAGKPVAAPPCYYDEFNPDMVPWVAPPERNLEEVFKHYRYFAISYIDDGASMEVTEYVRGNAVAVIRYRRDAAGALIEDAGQTSHVPQALCQLSWEGQAG